ncbi:YciI family protein [Kribbella deserti]|uniref:YciI family protein n=1 Tax=Kribbella deserti TaxID=1926257 RepID=A0ABV6QTZ7_9ACTN
MFVLELTYPATRDEGFIERRDAMIGEHIAWLKTHFEAGTFIASGRKEPRDGGIILAVGNDRVAMNELAGTDPFAIAGICTYRVTQFYPNTVAPALNQYRQDPPA